MSIAGVVVRLDVATEQLSSPHSASERELWRGVEGITMAQVREVRGVATNIFTDAEGTHIQYHSTRVVTLHKDGSVTLRTGGWRTSTTRLRMNQTFNQFGLPLKVYQKDYEWFVKSNDDRWPWTYQFNGNEMHIPCANGYLGEAGRLS